jgi:hypothetical protein
LRQQNSPPQSRLTVPAANVPAGGAGAAQEATDSDASGAGVAGGTPGSQQPGTGLVGGAEPGTQAGGEVAQGEAAPGQTGQPDGTASGGTGEPDALVAGAAGAGPPASAELVPQVGSEQDVAAVAPPRAQLPGARARQMNQLKRPWRDRPGSQTGLSPDQPTAKRLQERRMAKRLLQLLGRVEEPRPLRAVKGQMQRPHRPVAGSAGQPNTGLSESAESDLAARMSAGERPAGTIEQNDGTAPAAGGEAADQEIARLEPPSGAEASGPDTQGSADLSAGPGAAGAAGGTDPGRIEGNVVAGAPDEALLRPPDQVGGRRPMPIRRSPG